MVMKNPKKYGDAPFKIIVIHGGPGAPGEMAPVAEELSSDYGVLEPLQTKDSIKEQIETELHGKKKLKSGLREIIKVSKR